MAEQVKNSTSKTSSRKNASEKMTAYKELKEARKLIKKLGGFK